MNAFTNNQEQAAAAGERLNRTGGSIFRGRPAGGSGASGVSGVRAGGAAALMKMLVAMLAALPIVVVVVARPLPPWAYMWAVAFAIFATCKGLTFLHARATNVRAAAARNAAYLFAWPGMDPRSFFADIAVPARRETLLACALDLLKIATGACLILIVAPRFAAAGGILPTWIAMVGVMFLLHFGFLDLLARFWRSRGVDAKPLMIAPGLATSLAEFWGRRWNTGFHVLTERFVFQPLRKRIGANAALVAAFLASGLVHDVVVSIPAGAGFGLPTLYFLLQPLGIALQRGTLGRRFGLNRGPAGWLVTMLFVAAPVRLLFHDAFVLNVMLPLFRAMGAV